MEDFPLQVTVHTSACRRINSNVWGNATHAKLPQTILRYSFLRSLQHSAKSYL